MLTFRSILGGLLDYIYKTLAWGESAPSVAIPMTRLVIFSELAI